MKSNIDKISIQIDIRLIQSLVNEWAFFGEVEDKK